MWFSPELWTLVFFIIVIVLLLGKYARRMTVFFSSLRGSPMDNASDPPIVNRLMQRGSDVRTTFQPTGRSTKHQLIGDIFGRSRSPYSSARRRPRKQQAKEIKKDSLYAEVASCATIAESVRPRPTRNVSSVNSTDEVPNDETRQARQPETVCAVTQSSNNGNTRVDTVLDFPNLVAEVPRNGLHAGPQNESKNNVGFSHCNDSTEPAVVPNPPNLSDVVPVSESYRRRRSRSSRIIRARTAHPSGHVKNITCFPNSLEHISSTLESEVVTNNDISTVSQCQEQLIEKLPNGACPSSVEHSKTIRPSSVGVTIPTAQKKSKSRRKRRSQSNLIQGVTLEFPQCTHSSLVEEKSVEELKPQPDAQSSICDSEFEMIELPNISSDTKGHLSPFLETDSETIDVSPQSELQPVPPVRSLEHFPCLPGAESQFVCAPGSDTTMLEFESYPNANVLLTAALNEEEAEQQPHASGKKPLKSKVRRAD